MSSANLHKDELIDTLHNLQSDHDRDVRFFANVNSDSGSFTSLHSDTVSTFYMKTVKTNRHLLWANLTVIWLFDVN